MIDPHDPTLKERLRRRNPNGHFEISEIELVLSIRDLRAKGDNESARMLCTVLLERSAPEFQRHTWGLRHRPDLREEAIANMGEHLLREAMNPKEIFMTQNFIHYVWSLCNKHRQTVMGHCLRQMWLIHKINLNIYTQTRRANAF